MLRIACPFCGVRDEVEFRYRGDASVVRPSADEGEEAFLDYVYVRTNPKGRHEEWWLHVAGCRQTLRIVRDAHSHEILSVATARPA
jgi:heterotetrameric sarcosine oxidase delta subunit